MGRGGEGWSEKGGSDSQRKEVRDREAGRVWRWSPRQVSVGLGELRLGQRGRGGEGVLAGGGLVGFRFSDGFGHVCCDGSGQAF